MSIGIIGAGEIGSAFVRALARNGIAATIANSRGPDTLRDFVRELTPHITAGTIEEAARSRVLFYSGDEARSKAEVGALIAKLGFAGIDLGPVSVGGKLVQFPGGPLPALNLVKFG